MVIVTLVSVGSPLPPHADSNSSVSRAKTSPKSHDTANEKIDSRPYKCFRGKASLSAVDHANAACQFLCRTRLISVNTSKLPDRRPVA